MIDGCLLGHSLLFSITTRHDLSECLPQWRGPIPPLMMAAISLSIQRGLAYDVAKFRGVP